jgi:Ran GTPase-activating protein (RanGAP) involved in mRNA processing and transport
MQGSSDGQFVARYWLNSMPDIKIKAFQRNKGSSTLPGEGESQNSTKRSANSFLLASGVDFEFKGHDGKNDDMQSADFCSDNSQDSGDEVHIGTEQHNFKSPAPRPMGSPLSRDITVDLMRFRSSAVVPFKKSSYGARQGTQFFGSEANLQAIEVTDRRSLQREPVQSPRIILNDGLTPRPVCDNTLAGRVPTAIGDKHEKRFETRQLASALHSWREAHAVTMLQKQRIVDQYFGCCAFMKRSPFLKTQLRRLLIKPSEEHLDLSGCGVTGRDITALMSALSGRGCDMKPDRVKSIQEVCNSLGDSCLTSIDLCSNNLGAGGALALNNALIMSEFFRLEQTLPGTNMCELVASLTELDMSNNALGIAGSAPIETLLSSPRCTLTKLNLSSNMLADPGCAVVARAMCKNSSLKHLNLSENAAANSTGQAIGVLLETNSSLELLNIAYNHLRGNGAKRIGFGLSQNKSLRNLDLKWNGFGDEDVLSELSRAIPVCGVQELNLAYNRIKLKGASIIAASLEMGTMIRELILDGNLIGQIGARVIYRAAQEGHARQEFRTSVSTVNCGTHIVDRAAFDPCETAGAYDLNLQDTYDKSVLFKLMRVAMSDNGSFVSIKINSRVTQYNATLGNDNVKICDNDSIDMLDWTICTSSGINLPLMEETDESGTVPLSRSWAKLLGRREENVTCLLRFAFNNNRKRATLSDCLTQGNYELLQSAFSDPTCSGDKCVESIETIFGSDTFISMEQMDSLCKILCEQQDAARHAELSRTRVIFVARCFHKLVPPPDSSVVLDKMTSMEERKALEKALGTVRFDLSCIPLPA